MSSPDFSPGRAGEGVVRLWGMMRRNEQAPSTRAERTEVGSSEQARDPPVAGWVQPAFRRRRTAIGPARGPFRLP